MLPYWMVVNYYSWIELQWSVLWNWSTFGWFLVWNPIFLLHLRKYLHWWWWFYQCWWDVPEFWGYCVLRPFKSIGWLCWRRLIFDQIGRRFSWLYFGVALSVLDMRCFHTCQNGGSLSMSRCLWRFWCLCWFKGMINFLYWFRDLIVASLINVVGFIIGGEIITVKTD